IEDRVQHPLYGRIVKQTTKFKAHNEDNEARVGDTVKIMETRPLSKEKCWRVVEIVKKAE
ncbi:MAG: 30S ribosomal protein S17, partial [Bacillota bacterium]|nr:30S ribosomal protein S17 [Bacillota bacterium]